MTEPTPLVFAVGQATVEFYAGGETVLRAANGDSVTIDLPPADQALVYHWAQDAALMRDIP